MHKYKENLWKEHRDAYLEHRHIIPIRWKTIYGISNRAPTPTLNTSITLNSKITTTPKNIVICFTKQITNTVRNKATQKIEGYNITLTTRGNKTK